MSCPKCQSENPDTQKFCGECGAQFELECPQCGIANPPQYKFCGECGQKTERENFIKNQRLYWYIQSEYILGILYSQIAAGPKPALSTMAKNIGFWVKNVPRADKKAEEHFNKAIGLSKEFGTKGILGSAYLELGLFYQIRKKNNRAKECHSEAIGIFKESEADGYLKQAREAIASLEA